MALSSVAFIAPNYRDYFNWWLKAYIPGTTTPQTIYLDKDGVESAAKVQLNADGFFVSSGDALVIPYIENEYDLYLFPTAEDADNNDTSNAIRVADDIEPAFSSSTGSEKELSDAIEDEFVSEGDYVIIIDRDYGRFQYLSGQTPNGYDIIASNGVIGLSLVLVESYRTILMYGADTDGSTDYSGNFLEAEKYTSSVEVFPGTYNIPSGDFSSSKFHSFGLVTTNNQTFDYVNIQDIRADQVSTDSGLNVQEELDLLKTDSNKLVIFIPIGQSNATRWPDRVSGSATPLQLFTFNGGAQKNDDTAGQINSDFAVNESDMASLVSYNENGEDEEGTAPGFAAQIIGLSANTIYTWTGAIGSFHWRELRPSTSVWNSFAQALRQFTILGKQNGFDDIEYVFYLDHGESEADDLAPGGLPTDTPVTKQQYIDLLGNWNDSIRDYLGYITGKTTSIYSILLAPINFAGLTTEPTFTHREVQQAQLEYCLSTTNTFMIGGKSQLDVDTDNIHITGLGRRYYAERAGYIYNKIIAGEAWTPVYMKSANRSSTTVTVECNVGGGGQLVIDIDSVSDTAPFIAGSKYGFEYYDSSGKIDITDITVNGKTMTVTLDSTPNGVDELLRCAQIQAANATTSSDFKPRTSIRSSTNIIEAKLDSEVIYDFMVPHYIEVS